MTDDDDSTDLLIERFAERLHVSVDASREVLESVFSSIKSALESGNDVNLTGFGKFLVLTRQAYRVKSPETGEMTEMPKERTVTFQAASQLRYAIAASERVHRLRLRNQGDD